MRRAQLGPGVPRRTQIRGPGHGLGPGNTNVAGWVGSWVGTRYSTHPVPTPLHHPGYYPSPPHPGTACPTRGC